MKEGSSVSNRLGKISQALPKKLFSRTVFNLFLF